MLSIVKTLKYSTWGIWTHFLENLNILAKFSIVGIVTKKKKGYKEKFPYPPYIKIYTSFISN
jgi:hypothetical protein